jgi:hypothetical protein
MLSKQFKTSDYEKNNFTKDFRPVTGWHFGCRLIAL